MPVFVCSECRFSKEVPVKAIGKKAKCPKCEAVNIIVDAQSEAHVETLDGDMSEVVGSIIPDESMVGSDANGAAGRHQDEVEPNHEPRNDAVDSTQPEPEPETREQTSNLGSESTSSQLTSGWLAGFGVAGLLVMAGVGLFIGKLINLSMICFALGMIAFIALAIMYTFFGSSK